MGNPGKKPHRTSSPIILAFAAIGVATSPVIAQDDFTLFDFHGANFVALDINDSGQVVGSGVILSRLRARLWLPVEAYGLSAGFHGFSGIAELFPGIDPVIIKSIARGINESGQVVGVAFLLNEFNDPHSWMWLPEASGNLSAGIHDLGAGTEVYAINNLGHAVGHEDGRPLLWVDGNRIELACPNPPSCRSWLPVDINDIGQVVGSGILWQGGTFFVIDPPLSHYDAINNLTQIVGSKCFLELGQFCTHAVVWQNAAITDIHAFGSSFSSEGWDINDLGQVVGRFFGTSPQRAFLWLPGPAYGLPAGMTDLNDLLPPSELRLATARAINNRGQIVGHLFRPFASTRSFLLTPSVPPPDSATNFDFSGEDGDPVNTFTGELVLRQPADLDLGGPMPLLFPRYYASAMKQAGNITGRLGDNWLHHFELKLSHTDTTAQVVNDRAKVISFEKVGTVWILTDPANIPFQLVEVGTDFVLGDPQSERLYTFDSAGRLIGIEDGRGNTHTLIYSGDDLTQVSDGLGRGLTFTYDVDGHLANVSDEARAISFGYTGDNLTSYTDARGMTTTYAYAAGGLMTGETLPEGNTPYSQTYNRVGRVTSQTDANGNTYTFDYFLNTTTVTDPLGPGFGSTRVHSHTFAGELISVTDENDANVAIGSDDSGRRSSVNDRLGANTTMTFHPPSGKLASVTDSDGTTLSLSYSPRTVSGITSYEVTGRTFQDGTTESFAYDAAGNLISMADRAGKSGSFTYNGRGQVLSATNPVGGVTTHTYHPDGTLATVQDHTGNLTTYGYDTLQRRTLVTYADGTTRSFAYDNADHPVSITDERGNTTGFAYDNNGNLASVADALGNMTTYAYDGLDRVIGMTDPLVMTTGITYDELGNVRTLTDRHGHTTLFLYFFPGRVTGVIDPAGNFWGRSYNANGWLVSASNPTSNTVSYVYDSMGRITKVTSPLSNDTRFTYDSMGRVTVVEDPADNVTTYSYDPRGLISGTSLPGGAIAAAYVRNDLGQLTGITDPNGKNWLRDYDPQGRLNSRTDPLGNATGYNYDDRNRIASVTLPLGTLQLSYDASGNITRRLYSDGTDLTDSYDGNDRRVGATGVSVAYDARGDIVSANGLAITRDSGGRMTTITLAPGKSVTYAYDSRDLVTSITDWAGGMTLFDYDDAGRRTKITRPNGVETAFTYDGESRLIGIDETGLDVALSSISLVRGPRSLVIGATRDVPLTPKITAGTSALNYDVASQVAEFPYDSMGRLIDDGTWTYTWDLASRLSGYTDGAATVSFTYDAFGNPLTRTNGPTTREYVWNLALRLPSISVASQGGVDLRYYVHVPSGELLYSVEASDDSRRFYHFDEVGSTIFLTNDTGAITDSYVYSPYGVLLASTGSSENPFTYIGKCGVMAEDATGLYLMRQRVYDSASKRFLSRDPVSGQIDPQLINPYQYAAQNPLQYIDPTGADPTDATFADSQAGQTIGGGLKANQIVTYSTGAASGPVANVLDRTAQGIGRGTRALLGSGVRGPNVGRQLSQAKKFQDLAKNARGLGRGAKVLGKVGSAAGDALTIYDTYQKTRNVVNETKTLQRANVESLERSQAAVLELLNDKRLAPWQAEQLIRRILATFDESVAATDAAGRFGILTHSAVGFKNLLTSMLPAPAQWGLQAVLPGDPKK